MKVFLISLLFVSNFTAYSQQLEASLVTNNFRGVIADVDTGNPIPFASISLKDEGIYRICEENGSFNLQINTEISTNALVSITSIGYKEKKCQTQKFKGYNKVRNSC